MARILTDREIGDLLAEPKRLLRTWEKRLEPQAKTGDTQARRSLRVTGKNGNRFRIDVRDNSKSYFDFSIILSFIDADGEEYILVRFNGKTPSDHTNRWEKKQGKPNAKFRSAFHIHMATERYQLSPECKIDGYAEVTDRYHSLKSALIAFVSSNGFEVERDENEAKGQLSLFD
ncbi:MAG: hypothetical protein ABIK89_01620 [Planctomycetota bacterium]